MNSFALNLLKTISAIPTAFVVIYATYPMGWFFQTIALTIACTAQYTLIDYVLKLRKALAPRPLTVISAMELKPEGPSSSTK